MHDADTWLHVGAVMLPFPAAIVAFFLRQALGRLEKMEGKLDVAAETRGEMRAATGQLGARLDRVEVRLDKAS